MEAPGGDSNKRPRAEEATKANDAKKQNKGLPPAKGATLYEMFVSAGLEEEIAKKYEAVFKEHQVEAEMLPELSYFLLKSMGITTVGHQMKLMRLVRSTIAASTPVKMPYFGEFSDEYGSGNQMFGLPMRDGTPYKSRQQAPANTQEIRRRVRSAFVEEKGAKKQKRITTGSSPFGSSQTTYYLEAIIIREEVRKAKQLLGQGDDVLGALTVMEAITDEYVNFETEVGENNISGYGDYLIELVKDWVEVFLARNCNLEKNSRDVWETKLSIWDKSADKEHGTFVTAKYAAKHGWDDTLLNNVLQGDFIGKFYEPTGLVIARLNMLETEYKFDEGYNLAKAMDLFSWTARFLLKLNKVTEAEEIAWKIKEPAGAFSIAQVARPLDVKVAFNVAVYAISLAEEWSADSVERVSWLVELAVSEKILDKLVSDIREKVKVKPIQFEICKIMHRQEQLQAAVELAQICLKPYSNEELKVLTEEKEKRLNPLAALNPDKPPFNPNNVDVAFLVPKTLAKWLWETVYQMQVLKVITPEKMNETLDLILALVVDVPQLIEIAQQMNAKAEYGLIFKVGNKCIELLDKQSKEANSKKEEFLSRQYQIQLLTKEEEQYTLKRQQLPAEKQAQLKQLRELQATALVSPYHDPSHDNSKLQVCRIMITSALDSLTCIIPEKVLSRPEIDKVVQLCVNSIEDINHLINLAADLQGKNQFSYVLRATERAQKIIVQLVKANAERDEVREKLKIAQTEQQELTAKRQQLTDKQLENLHDLELKVLLFQLAPRYATLPNTSYDNLNLQVAQLMVTAGLDIKKEKIQDLLQNPQPDSHEKEKAIEEDLWKIVILCLEHVLSPKDIMQLGAILRSRESFGMVLRLGKLCIQRVREMMERHKSRIQLLQQQKVIEDHHEFLQYIKKPIDQEQATRKEKLELEIQALPKLPNFDPFSSDEYEKLIFSVTQQILGALFDSKQKTETKIAKDLEMTEEHIKAERKVHTVEIEQVLDYCLVEVQNPNDMIQLVAMITNGKEYTLTLSAANKIFQHLEKLAVQRAQREPYLQELVNLQTERDKLSITKKTLEAKDQAKLEQLLFQNLVERQGPAYLFYSQNQMDYLALDLAQLVIRSLLTWSDELEQRVELDVEKLLPQASIENDRKAITAEINKGVALCVTFVKDPSHQFLLEEAVSKRQRKQVDIVFKLGQKCQETIKEINALRAARAPIQKQIDHLKQEIEGLEKIKKPTTEQTNQVLDLEKQLAKLPKYPHFSHLLDYYEYDSLNFKIVRVMITVVLATKENFEQRVKQMIDFPDAAPPIPAEQITKERAKIKEQIDSIVALCLTNVHDPSHLVKFQAEVQQKKEYEIVIEVGKKCMQRIRQLDEQREVRAPIQARLDMLKREEDELAQKKKTLEAEQQAELSKLESQLQDLPDWPHYASLFDYNQYHPLVHKIVAQMLSSVLDRKATFQAKIKQMEVSEDPALHSAETSGEREAIQNQLNFATDFVLANVGDPQHLIAVQQQLEAGKELEKVLEMGEKCQDRIAHLEALQAQRAPLQAQWDQIQREKLQLQMASKKLGQQEEDELKRIEKQLSDLPPYPRYASLMTYAQYNNTNYQVTLSQLRVVVQAKQQLELKVKELLDSGMVEEKKEQEFAKERKTLETFFNQVVSLGLKNLKNPQHLFSFETDLNKMGEGDTALKVGEKCLHRIKELNGMRDVRAPIQRQIDEIKQEEQELAQQKKQLTPEQQKLRDELNAKIQKLPQWPYYGDLIVYHQYDRLTLQTSLLMLNIALQKLDAFEVKIQQQRQDDPASVKEDEVLKERGVLEAQRAKAVEMCLAHVEDPNLLLEFSQTLESRGQSSFVLQVAAKAFKSLQFAEEQRKIRDSIAEHITILKEEESKLEQEKKQLPPAHEKQLASLVEKQKTTIIRNYVATAKQHDKLALQIAKVVLNSVWSMKQQWEDKLKVDEELPEDAKIFTAEQIKQIKQTIETEVKQAIKLFKENLKNPSHLLTVTKTLKGKNERAIVLDLGYRNQEMLATLQKNQIEAQTPKKQLIQLQEERTTLEQNRKQLPIEKQEQLFQLLLGERLLARDHDYVNCDANNYDDLNFNIANEIISCLLEEQAEFEDKVAMDDSIPAKKVEAERKRLKDQLEEIISACLKNVHKVQNLLALTANMHARKEFQLVIRIGMKCEERIAELRKELEEREELNERQLELAEKISLQKDGPTKKQTAEQHEIAAALEKLPLVYDDAPQLNSWTLQCADYVIAAAKIEDNDEVLREQTTMAFKVQTTPERWNQVKQLTAEGDWEEVKKELVVYLLKASTDADSKNSVDPMIQMDLLLKEGLWKECIEIFPAPTGKNQELDVLANMWLEVEKNQPAALSTLTPVIEKYLKKFYTDWKYVEFEKILDQVQRSCPNVILDLYAKGSEVMLVNMTPTRYKDFVSFIKSFKKRMESIGKKKDWEKFFSEFKKVHKGKKKLMNMVNMISESFSM